MSIRPCVRASRPRHTASPRRRHSSSQPHVIDDKAPDAGCFANAADQVASRNTALSGSSAPFDTLISFTCCSRNCSSSSAASVPGSAFRSNLLVFSGDHPGVNWRQCCQRNRVRLANSLDAALRSASSSTCSPYVAARSCPCRVRPSGRAPSGAQFSTSSDSHTCVFVVVVVANATPVLTVVATTHVARRRHCSSRAERGVLAGVQRQR